MKRLKYAPILLALTLTGCATLTEKMATRVKPGMTKAQVMQQFPVDNPRKEATSDGEIWYFNTPVTYCQVHFAGDVVSRKPECVYDAEKDAAMWSAVRDHAEAQNSRQDRPTSTGIMHCGIRPLPKIGCAIGRCVNGAWEQVCN